MDAWHDVHFPLKIGDFIPAERKVVAVWLRGSYLPHVGYIRYGAGDINSPYFVVYHGNPDIGAEVIAWCDCMPASGPDVPWAFMYTQEQNSGRGFPAGIAYAAYASDPTLKSE